MGVLESRVLDFETVIITSVNEGKFPAVNSFIPCDVKRELGLPTYKEKSYLYVSLLSFITKSQNVFP
jgi:inactivated superfamily I helicase